MCYFTFFDNFKKKKTNNGTSKTTLYIFQSIGFEDLLFQLCCPLRIYLYDSENVRNTLSSIFVFIYNCHNNALINLLIYICQMNIIIYWVISPSIEICKLTNVYWLMRINVMTHILRVYCKCIAKRNYRFKQILWMKSVCKHCKTSEHKWWTYICIYI